MIKTVATNSIPAAALASDPIGGAYSAPPAPVARFTGATSNRKKGERIDIARPDL